MLIKEYFSKYKFFILLVFSLLISTFFWWHYFGNFQIYDDAVQYHEIAQNLLNDHSFSYQGELTMIREPGYPFFLFLVYKIFGVNPQAARILQVLMLLSVSVIVYYVSGRIFNSSVAKASSILAVVYPMFNILTASLLSEILACWLIMAFFLLFYFAVSKKKYYLYGVSGIFLGLALMVKFAFIFMSFIIFAFIVFYKFKEDWKGNIKRAVIFGFFLSLIIAPWLVRNYVYFNKISLASRGGVLIYARALKNTYDSESAAKYVVSALTGEYFIRRFVDPEYVFENDYIRKSDIIKFRDSQREILNTGNYDVIDAAMAKEAKDLIKKHPARYLLFGLVELVILNSPMIYHERHFSIFHDNIYGYTALKSMAVLIMRLVWWAFAVLTIYGIMNIIKVKNYLAYIPIFFILEINMIIFFLQGNPRFLIPVFPFCIILFVHGAHTLFFGKGKPLQYDQAIHNHSGV